MSYPNDPQDAPDPVPCEVCGEDRYPDSGPCPHCPTTPEEARDRAIQWQHEAQPTSWAELADAQEYFEGLARQFPELAGEFRENGII